MSPSDRIHGRPGKGDLIGADLRQSERLTVVLSDPLRMSQRPRFSTGSVFHGPEPPKVVSPVNVTSVSALS